MIIPKVVVPKRLKQRSRVQFRLDGVNTLRVHVKINIANAITNQFNKGEKL